MKSRWFRVIADRFDWMPTPRVMRTWARGEIGYAPASCVKLGVHCGLIEEIEKPKGYKVDKAGVVHAE